MVRWGVTRGDRKIRTVARRLCAVLKKYARSAILTRGPAKIRASSGVTRGDGKIRAVARRLCAVLKRYARSAILTRAPQNLPKNLNPQLHKKARQKNLPCAKPNPLRQQRNSLTVRVDQVLIMFVGPVDIAT